MSRQMTFQEAATHVKHSLDIVDIVTRYVALKKAGRNYLGLCPFHAEKTPSFNVNREKQLFKCFGCGEGGDALSFLMKQEHKTYGEIIVSLAEDQGIEILRDGKPIPGRDELDTLIQLHHTAKLYYQQQLHHAEPVKTYLAERHITPDWQERFGLGYAPAGWENLVNHLKQQEDVVRQSPALLEKAGLANLRSEGHSYYDRFRNRLMIPIQDERGRVIAFGGRSLSAEDNPKYLNSPETPIYVKNRVLYGLFHAKEAIRKSGYVILMEGYFDVLAAHMAGIEEAVGVCGTSLTEQHLKLLSRQGAEKLYLCFDADEAGQTAALRAIELIENQILTQGVALQVVNLPDAKDPDEFLKAHGKEAFLSCLQHAEDFLQFKFRKALAKISDLQSPHGRIQAVQVLVPMLLKINQPVVRQEHIKLLAEQLHIAEETLLLELKRSEKGNLLHSYKKNYSSDAIFRSEERYTGRKRWDTSRSRKRPEDITVFQRHLSERLPVTEKEHLLLSYLFLNEESYAHTMTFLRNLSLHSEPAKHLLAMVEQLEGQWTSINNLINQLNERCHQTENHEMIAFLADRVLKMEALQEQDATLSGHTRQTIEKLAHRIQELQQNDALTHLNRNSKSLEAKDDDQSALEIQIRLREAIKLRQKSGSSPHNNLNGLDRQDSGSLSMIIEEQGA